MNSFLLQTVPFLRTSPHIPLMYSPFPLPLSLCPSRPLTLSFSHSLVSTHPPQKKFSALESDFILSDCAVSVETKNDGTVSSTHRSYSSDHLIDLSDTAFIELEFVSTYEHSVSSTLRALLGDSILRPSSTVESSLRLVADSTQTNRKLERQATGEANLCSIALALFDITRRRKEGRE